MDIPMAIEILFVITISFSSGLHLTISIQFLSLVA